MNFLLTLTIILFQVQILKGQEILSKPNKELIRTIQSTNGFVALWKFDEKPGEARKAILKTHIIFPMEWETMVPTLR